MRYIIGLLLALFTGVVHASSAQKQVIFENELRNRIYAIIEKVDASAIVQVELKLKKVNSEMPTFGFNAEVTPVEYDGDLGASSLESISVRVLTQVDTVPDWIQGEIRKTATIGDVKLDLQFEKATGAISNWKSDLTKGVKEVSQAFGDTVKYTMWALIAAIAIGLPIVAFAVMSLSRRMERTLAKVIDEKLVPAMAQSGGRGGRDFSKGESGESSARPATLQGIAGGAPGGGKELADIPDSALLNLMCDCYWSEADGYAHYLWSQMSHAQRKAVLASDAIDHAYFSYFREHAPVNLNYHMDAKYLTSANEFKHVNQKDLADWLRKNQKACGRVTPLRWDTLPLGLAERLALTEFRAMHADEAAAPKAKSPARSLPVRFEIKSLKLEDEEYLWNNPEKVPANLRSSLRSLVWLALAPDDYRQNVLAELDARQLAEAWSGPEAVLGKLRSSLPQRKVETLDHMLKSVSPDRGGSVFSYLCEAGLRAPAEIGKGAERKAA